MKSTDNQAARRLTSTWKLICGIAAIGLALLLGVSIGSRSHRDEIPTQVPTANQVPGSARDLAEQPHAKAGLSATKSRPSEDLLIESAAIESQARDAVEQHDSKRAEDLLRQAVTLVPTNSDARVELGKLLLGLKRPAESLEWLAPITGPDSTNFTALATAGSASMALETKDSVTAATRYLNRAHELNPRDPSVALNLSMIYLDAQVPDKIIALLEPMVQPCIENGRPTNSETLLLFMLGDAYRNIGKSRAAVTCFKTILAVDSQNDGANRELADLAFADRDYSGTLKYLAAINEPRQSDFLLSGRALGLSGNQPAAMESFRKAVRLSPKSLEGYKLLATSSASAGALESAIQAAKDGLAIDAKSIDLHGVLISALVQREDWGALLGCLDAASRAGMDAAEVDELKGLSLLNLDRPGDATLYLRSAASSGKSQTCLSLLALCLERTKDWTGAAEQYQRLEALDPGSKQKFQESRARCFVMQSSELRRRGNSEGAIQALFKAVDIDPSSENRKLLALSLASQCDELMLAHKWNEARDACRYIMRFDSDLASKIYKDILEGERLSRGR